MGTANPVNGLKILVALDDSSHSTAAVNLLSRITWPARTSVHLLTVVPDYLPQMERDPETPNEVDEAIELMRWRGWAAASAHMADAAKQLKAHNLEAQTEVCEGPVLQVLKERATDLSSNLVVIDAKRLCPPDQFKLTSEARELVVQTDYSILVTRPSEQVRPLNTLVAVNDSSEAWKAVEFLCSLSLPQWARVTVVTVPGERSATAPYSLPVSGQHIVSTAEVCINKAIERLHQCSVQVRTIIRPGPAADEIVSAAREEATDLIVVGSQAQSDSLAQEVVKRAPCSVLAVHGMRQADSRSTSNQVAMAV